MAAVDPLDKDTIKQIEFFTDLQVVCWLAPIGQIYLGLKSFIPSFQPKQTLIGDFLEHHATTIFYGKNRTPDPYPEVKEQDILVSPASEEIQIEDETPADTLIEQTLEDSLPSDIDDDDFEDSLEGTQQVSEESLELEDEISSIDENFEEPEDVVASSQKAMNLT